MYIYSYIYMYPYIHIHVEQKLDAIIIDVLGGCI